LYLKTKASESFCDGPKSSVGFSTGFMYNQFARSRLAGEGAEIVQRINTFGDAKGPHGVSGAIRERGEEVYPPILRGTESI
jgi:hypothetical protein